MAAWAWDASTVKALTAAKNSAEMCFNMLLIGECHHTGYRAVVGWGHTTVAPGYGVGFLRTVLGRIALISIAIALATAGTAATVVVRHYIILAGSGIAAGSDPGDGGALGAGGTLG